MLAFKSSLFLPIWWKEVDELREASFDSGRQVRKEILMRAQGPVGDFSCYEQFCSVSPVI